MALKQLSAARCFGGSVRQYSHTSSTLKCDMKFSVFLPPAAAHTKVPVLYWLSGLTCTDQNFITKAGAQRVAAKHNIALICPDTSPRDVDLGDVDDSAWDFGSGAGFYVNATVDPWAKHYHMYDYVTKELPSLISAELPVDHNRVSIFGHSMGGHGALICALKNPGKYKSVSAFAPISNPMQCPWGKKAFSGYLGNNQDDWKQYDATELVKTYAGPQVRILVDQGTDDGFYKEKQLLPEHLKAATDGNDKVNLKLRMQEGYDHSYYFIATFVEDHLNFHAKELSTE